MRDAYAFVVGQSEPIGRGPPPSILGVLSVRADTVDE